MRRHHFRGLTYSVAERCDMTDTGALELFASFTSRAMRLFPSSVSISGGNPRSRFTCKSGAWVGYLILVVALSCAAQPQSPSSTTGTDGAALQELQSQVRELKELVLELPQQAVDSHAEITRLRG